jgi:hypothetical protein
MEMKNVKTPRKHINARTNCIKGLHTVNKKDYQKLVKNSREIII